MAPVGLAWQLSLPLSMAVSVCALREGIASITLLRSSSIFVNLASKLEIWAGAEDVTLSLFSEELLFPGGFSFPAELAFPLAALPLAVFPAAAEPVATDAALALAAFPAPAEPVAVAVALGGTGDFPTEAAVLHSPRFAIFGRQIR